MSYLLDTHVWIWLQLADEQNLSPAGKDQLLQWQTQEALFVSPISAWELALLTSHSYVELGGSVDQFVERATSDGGLRLLPLTTRILIESTRLPGELHHDPADRILAATAREYGLTLLTRDKLLLQYAKLGHLSARKL